MMNKVYAIALADGGVAIMHCAEGIDPAAEVARWPREVWRGPFGDRITIPIITEIDPSNIPADRTFRNALKSDLTVDMQKAREIHRERMRRARAPLFDGLDVEYIRADENADLAEKVRIVTKKQALRDVTADPAIEAATTPEELKAVWPKVLE